MRLLELALVRRAVREGSRSHLTVSRSRRASALVAMLLQLRRPSTLLEVVDLLVLRERRAYSLLSVAKTFLEQHVGGSSLTSRDSLGRSAHLDMRLLWTAVIS